MYINTNSYIQNKLSKTIVMNNNNYEFINVSHPSIERLASKFIVSGIFIL